MTQGKWNNEKLVAARERMIEDRPLLRHLMWRWTKYTSDMNSLGVRQVRAVSGAGERTNRQAPWSASTPDR